MPVNSSPLSGEEVVKTWPTKVHTHIHRQNREKSEDPLTSSWDIMVEEGKRKEENRENPGSSVP